MTRRLKEKKEDVYFSKFGDSAPQEQRCALCHYFRGDDLPCSRVYGPVREWSWCIEFQLRESKKT